MKLNCTSPNWTFFARKFAISGEKARTIFVQLAIALSSGALLDWLQVPIGWLLGPMVVGILWVLACGRSQPLPTAFSTAGQALVALATAASFSLEALTKAISCGMPLLLCILVTGAMSLFNGYLLSRWTGIDRATSFLGCLPGASHSLVAMALFRRLKRKTGIAIHPHILRHTHATDLIREGMEMAYVQKRLGHASIQTTIDTYVHDRIFLRYCNLLYNYVHKVK